MIEQKEEEESIGKNKMKWNPLPNGYILKQKNRLMSNHLHTRNVNLEKRLFQRV
jgi:hypothetical protein